MAQKLYEGLFLFDPAQINSSIQTATDTLNEIFARSGATVHSLFKWDDRRLAYDVAGQKRGIYMLSYFNVEGPNVIQIERDAALNEQILRCLILRADHVGETELELATRNQADSLAAAALVGEPAPAGDAQDLPEDDFPSEDELDD